MTANLSEQLTNHQKWLNNEPGGKRLVLQNANLSGMDLRYANLQGAILREANLQEARLRWADLRWANLENADLHGAELHGAELRLANLQGAALQRADLQRANLQGVNLQGAELRWADLQGANLYTADLRGADLQGANLEGADLDGANLEGAKLPDFQKMREGEPVIGWKKVEGDIILMLEITGQRTCTLTSNVCRCSEAKVLEAFTHDGIPVTNKNTFNSLFFHFIYELGKVVRVPNYDGDIRRAGAPGIHFFLNRKDAETYLVI